MRDFVLCVAIGAALAGAAVETSRIEALEARVAKLEQADIGGRPLIEAKSYVKPKNPCPEWQLEALTQWADTITGITYTGNLMNQGKTWVKCPDGITRLWEDYLKAKQQCEDGEPVRIGGVIGGVLIPDGGGTGKTSINAHVLIGAPR